MYKNVEIIAEVKTQSPFGFKSEKSWDYLFEIANEIGDLISIHVEEEFGGSRDLLIHAKSLTDKLIVAKGYHRNDEEINRSFDAGADFVLSVGRKPLYTIKRVLFEPNNLQQLQGLESYYKVVWNKRNLKNEKKKIQTFQQAREMFGGWLCQASFIKSVEDIEPGANAVLVGEHLEEFYKSFKGKV